VLSSAAPVLCNSVRVSCYLCDTRVMIFPWCVRLPQLRSATLCYMLSSSALRYAMLCYKEGRDLQS
jgi:hypothetical protein